jgi:hypothetical protein
VAGLSRKLPACFGVVALCALTYPDARDRRSAAWTDDARAEPLRADEEVLPEAAALARRFNPAMAFRGEALWPVDVRYAWRDGAPVMGEVKAGRGKPARRFVAVPNPELERRAWDDLPSTDEDGRPIRYTVDAPGDDREAAGTTGWRARWEALVKTDPVATAPTQYAHLFWVDRQQGLLGIQYWFYFPFNEWVNRHEADWEHVNVILKGPRALSAETADAFRPVGYQFFFHGWRLDTDRVTRIGGAAAHEDHVLVFSGGRGKWLWWGGAQSGASYPWPALFRGAGSGPLPPDEDARAPTRFLPASAFRVVVLPEPDRLDATARPELSWLKLDFYAGQDDVHTNPPLVNWLGYGRAPSQPARRKAWNAASSKTAWPCPLPAFAAGPLALPPEWPVLATPAPERRKAPTASLAGAAF